MSLNCDERFCRVGERYSRDYACESNANLQQSIKEERPTPSVDEMAKDRASGSKSREERANGDRDGIDFNPNH
ncbi:hypothetical protein HDF12_003861 [Edaphobacter lichenicola]|uniref:Uncharacterized protein n=2 Tax=Tunturiibacter TaxID=3154218 RepID=A0A7Y9NQH9_9BACT|nr:hypothetical protein [Edaphobacter lichenicola]NYF53462.1 hypothetical protein [Edaphobacter lichenicola]